METKQLAPETSDQAQADTLAKAMLLICEKSAEYRKKISMLELECKALALECTRLRAKCERYEIQDLERRRFQEEG